MSFANQVAVITGASSGIGWALAKELSRQGARVGLVARRRENLQKLAAEIAAANRTPPLAAADPPDRPPGHPPPAPPPTSPTASRPSAPSAHCRRSGGRSTCSSPTPATACPPS